VKKLTGKRIGAGRYPLVANFRGWAQPDMAVDQILTGDPYPIKAAWIQTTNMLGGQAADTRKHYERSRSLISTWWSTPSTIRRAWPWRTLCSRGNLSRERKLPILVVSLERGGPGDQGG